MNDLNGLNWSVQPPKNQNAPNYNAAFSSLRPAAPASGRASPLSASALPKPPSKPPTPANDSFSNLVSFSSSNTSKNLTLQEQQKRLADLKLKKATYGDGNYKSVISGDESFWTSLESGRSTPAHEPIKNHPAEDDDFLAAFNAPSTIPVQLKVAKPPNEPSLKASELMIEDEDDDPFGLSQFQAKQNARQNTEASFDDEDILGLLGQPTKDRPARKLVDRAAPVPLEGHPQDKAIAELVDMGFSAAKAKQALESTESGTDVQAAVSWLLNQAHTEARERTRAQQPVTEDRNISTKSRTTRNNAEIPQPDSRSGTPSNDATKVVGEFGTTFLKTAGSLWKQGQKKVQQAVQEFNSDSDSSQPKWMREPQTESKPSRRSGQPTDGPRRRRSSAEKQTSNATDEALMLEISRPERPQRSTQRTRPDMMFDSSANTSRDHSPAMPSRLRDSQESISQARVVRPQAVAPPRATLNRQAAEEQAATAYVSSARRRKPPPTASAVSSTAETDLLEQASKPIMKQPPPKPQVAPQTAKRAPIPVRPQIPSRDIPSISAISLKASHVDRLAGNEHFKRGDFASAHASYAKSITYLPRTHPIAIVLLTNRALTALKTGEPKAAVIDADAAISIIGISKGESETVDLLNGDPAKPMREYYGKALMRKAEALEQMEKWSDAALVWQEAVEGGHGGATSIQGRARAEKAANPQATKPAAPRKPVARPPGRPNKPTLASGSEAAAVSRLRAQNAAAEKADDERFALSDSVDARITAWKGGKQDNLRALLGSLDIVLWPEANWKKISMADLVLPGKVKVQYMKGIAKVHPDKIPTNASTEQRMIAGAVFSALNDAWDRFKQENGL